MRTLNKDRTQCCVCLVIMNKRSYGEYVHPVHNKIRNDGISCSEQISRFLQFYLPEPIYTYLVNNQTL